MTRIEFVIDELVLMGFPPNDRHRIADSLANALSTMDTDVQHALRSAAASGGLMPALRAPNVPLSSEVHGSARSGEAIGADVGRSIASAIASTNRDTSRG